jgi:hypothetical protein
VSIVFSLAECDTCEIQYAVAPDPYFAGQVILFDRAKSLETPTHITIGGLICLRGHTLRVTCKEAVMADNGDWVRVEHEHTIPSWN